MNLSERTKVSLSVGSFILCLVFIVSSTFALGAWTANIENEINITQKDVTRVEESCFGCSDKIKALEDSDDKQSIQFAEIKKDLEYIKIMIMDLSEAVK